MDEVARLSDAFYGEIVKIYASHMLSGRIPPARRGHVLAEVARLRSKYNQKLVSLRMSHGVDAVDRVEQSIMKIENQFAARLDPRTVAA